MWFFEPDTRSGRSALHTACWLADTVTVKAILEAANKANDQPILHLDDPCHESGWPCLLYAAVAGSFRCVELLLEQGASAGHNKMSEVHTWLKSKKKGATVLQFCC